MSRVLQTAMLREEAVGTAEKLIEQGKREGLREGLQEGLEKGRQEGVQEQREHTARELLARGLSVVEIAQVTGLSEDEVRALAEQSQT